MASIERYTTDAGPRYSVRYRTPDGRQTQKRGFKTKRDAELFLATTEVKMATGDYVAPKLGRVTVGELAPAWLERKRLLSASTYRGNELHWRLHVAPRWASTPVSAVDLLAVEAWITSLISSGAGAQTVRKSYSVLVGILNDAVKGKRLAANPAKGVENLPAMSKKRHVYLTADDVARLAENAGDRRAFVLTLAYCGLRYGEAIALRVRNIEFLRRRLSVVESATYVGGRLVIGRPKTSGSVRSVPVPEFVLDALSAECVGKGSNDLVFPGRSGGYMVPVHPTRGWFATAVRRSGIQRVTPHDLRHTCASLAVSAGVNVLALSRMLGHAQPSMTLDVYVDLFDSDLDAAAAVMHGRYGESVSNPCPQGLGEGS